MALGDVTFVKGEGGLGRPLPGEDYISGLLFYTSSLPSGWTSSARVKKLFSPGDANANGILPNFNKNNPLADANFADATAATYTSVIVRGATGDSIRIVYTGIGGVVLDLGTYVQTGGDTTLPLFGASLAAFINGNSYVHGCTASFSTNMLTITLPKSQGIFPNTGAPVSISPTGAITAGAPALGVSGTVSVQAVWYYHISEFFRLQPQGYLYVGFYAVPGSYTFTEITAMQTFAQGTIRQIGVYKDAAAFASADLTTIHNEIVNNNDANHAPLSALYAADLTATSDVSTLVNLNTLSANKVTPVISQDGGARGAFLYTHYGKSITTLGAALGAVALSAVSQSIMWVANFNISDGVECDTPAFANGKLISSYSKNYLNAIDNLRYVFLVKYVGKSGSYFNHSYTATTSSSDYAFIENNRTIDKACRGIYVDVLPSLGSPLKLNADGTLKDTTVAFLESQAEGPCAQMERDGDLSAYKITIDPTQNVRTSGKLYITADLLPVDVATAIQVNIGFVPKII